MDDHFLYNHQKLPRVEFSQGLYQRLEVIDIQQSTHRWGIRRKPALLMISFCLALTVMLMIIPSSRGAIQEVIERIGNLVFHQTDANPYMDQNAHTIPEQIISLAEARDMLPFHFGVPAWSPADFILQEDKVLISQPGESHPFYLVRLVWQSSDGSLIDQRVLYPTVPDYQSEMIIGPGSIEQLTVNNTPAALVHGAWNADSGEYDDALGMISLIWEVDGLYYSLDSRQDSVSADDLVRMAESIR